MGTPDEKEQAPVPIPQQMREVIAGIDDFVDHSVRRHPHSDTLSREVKAMIEGWWEHGAFETFDQYERWLEGMGSRVFLYGDRVRNRSVPHYADRRFLPEGKVDPRAGKAAEFFLQVGLDRAGTFDSTLRDLKIDRDENLARLAISGTELWSPEPYDRGQSSIMQFIA